MPNLQTMFIAQAKQLESIQKEYQKLANEKTKYNKLAKEEKQELGILLQEERDAKEKNATIILRLVNTKKDWENRIRYAKEDKQKAKKVKNTTRVKECDQIIINCTGKKKDMEYKIAEIRKEIKKSVDARKRSIQITRDQEAEYKAKARVINTKMIELKKQFTALSKQHKQVTKAMNARR